MCLYRYAFQLCKYKCVLGSIGVYGMHCMYLYLFISIGMYRKNGMYCTLWYVLIYFLVLSESFYNTCSMLAQYIPIHTTIRANTCARAKTRVLNRHGIVLVCMSTYMLVLDHELIENIPVGCSTALKSTFNAIFTVDTPVMSLCLDFQHTG